MKYRSTRGHDAVLSFEQAVLAGLAPDGGLYVPDQIPTLPGSFLSDWKSLSFQDLAVTIFSLFIPDSEVPRHVLKELVTRSYASFTHDPPTPVKFDALDKNIHVLELFHGPTLAFKDVALQFLGNLFEYFLERRNKELKKAGKDEEKMTVVGATSGDTGSAAIYGLRGKKNVSVFILHPRGRVSPVQEAQMTTVLDENVHNLAIEGTFDDCQDIVKELFADAPFRSKHHLGAVNSINWARILAQTVYYFHSYFSLVRHLPDATQLKVRYVVPTGNFGDILAGYYATLLGLPVAKLTVATNENDILARFFATGRYEKMKVPETEAESPAVAPERASKRSSETSIEAVRATTSPAMDILVSSNFERLLWHLAKDEATATSSSTETGHAETSASRSISEWMIELKSSGGVKIDEAVVERARKIFDAGKTDDEQTLKTIREVYDRTGYLLDPHTAVGVHAATLTKPEHADSSMHTICLSTAHPAKFPSAIHLALRPTKGELPQDVATLLEPPVFEGLMARERKLRFIAGPSEGSGAPPSAKVVMDIIENELALERSARK